MSLKMIVIDMYIAWCACAQMCVHAIDIAKVYGVMDVYKLLLLLLLCSYVCNCKVNHICRVSSLMAIQ